MQRNFVITPNVVIAFLRHGNVVIESDGYVARSNLEDSVYASFTIVNTASSVGENLP